MMYLLGILVGLGFVVIFGVAGFSEVNFAVVVFTVVIFGVVVDGDGLLVVLAGLPVVKIFAKVVVNGSGVVSLVVLEALVVADVDLVLVSVIELPSTTWNVWSF